MPNNTTQQQPDQAQKGNIEQMLITYLKELEQQVADLSSRVDVLENGSNPQQNTAQ